MRKEDDWFPQKKKWTTQSYICCFVRWSCIWLMIGIGIIYFFGDQL